MEGLPEKLLVYVFDFLTLEEKTICKWVSKKWFSINKKYKSTFICTYASENGYLTMLKWAREKRYFWDRWTCTLAAWNGHLDILKWIRENGCKWDKWTCAYAASNGHLEILTWARENGCLWDENTSLMAAQNGHLEVLKWVLMNGCPGDVYVSGCLCAAKNGYNFKVLILAGENKFAEHNRYYEIEKWAREHGQ